MVLHGSGTATSPASAMTSVPELKEQMSVGKGEL